MIISEEIKKPYSHPAGLKEKHTTAVRLVISKR
jgi:hypothetical protein